MSLNRQLKRVEDTSKVALEVERPAVSGRVGESVEVEKKIEFGQRRAFEDWELKRRFGRFAVKGTGEGKIRGGKRD